MAKIGIKTVAAVHSHVADGSFGDIESRTDYGSFTPKSDGKSGHPEEAHFPDQAAR